MTAFKNIALFLFGLLLFGCGPEAPEKVESPPEWLIPEDKMVDILTDVHIIEGARIGTKVLGDTLPVKVHYDLLWHKHEINQALYDSSFQYYSRNAERMDVMYEEVLTRLTKVSSRIETPATKKDTSEPEPADSTQAADIADSSKVDSKKEDGPFGSNPQ